MSKVGLGVKAGTGADPQLAHEQESGGRNCLITYAFEGRLIPVAATAAHSAISVDNTASVDLIATHKPTGATFLRVAVKAGGGDLSFWDDGKDAHTNEGLVIAAGNWMDFPNLEDLPSTLSVCGTSATAALVRMAWYKRL